MTDNNLSLPEDIIAESIAEDVLSSVLSDFAAAQENTRKVTVLEAWWELLKRVPVEKELPITMDMVIPVINNFPWLQLYDVPTHFKTFYKLLGEALEILTFEIESEPECLERGEDDAELNHGHYLNVLIGWNKMLKVQAETWDVSALSAGAEMSGTISANEFLVGANGLTAHLGAIDFQYSNEDRDLVNGAVNEVEV